MAGRGSGTNGGSERLSVEVDGKSVIVSRIPVKLTKLAMRGPYKICTFVQIDTGKKWECALPSRVMTCKVAGMTLIDIHYVSRRKESYVVAVRTKNGSFHNAVIQAATPSL